MPHFQRPGFSMNYTVIDGILPRDTLFLHGNLSSNLWWEPAIEEWKKQDGGSGKAILAEWRGCGDSREFEGGLDIQTLAADANALLENLSITNANIIGHSTGGLIALHAMAARPELYHRALLLDPVSPDGLELPPEIAGAFTRMSQEEDFCATVILSTIHGGSLSEAYRQQIAKAAFGVAPAVWLGVPQMLATPPKLATQKITHPVLVAHGEFDVVLPMEKSKSLAASLLKGKFMEISGRGHCTNVEDPERFTGIVNEFLY
jgi:pimeloyl-ACP methyl ester carboxylesterase